MTLKEAIAITGGLSKTSKMPCASWGISAQWCKTGAKLSKDSRSTCSQCYAKKGRYQGPNVNAAHMRRLVGLEHPDWVEAMVKLIQHEKRHFFRWFDSGDLQGTGHLAHIVDICRATPGIYHWLPTQERALINKFFQANHKPSNLTIRVSSALTGLRQDYKDYPVSWVSNLKSAITCPAKNHDNQCEKCRKCWDPNIHEIVYGLH